MLGAAARASASRGGLERAGAVRAPLAAVFDEFHLRAAARLRRNARRPERAGQPLRAEFAQRGAATAACRAPTVGGDARGTRGAGACQPETAREPARAIHSRPGE